MKNAWRLLLLAANLIGSSVVAEDDLVDAKVDDLAEMYEEEPPYFPCRRDPTWQRTVNYEHCRALSEWNPYGTWWALDHEMVEERLDGREQELATCLHLAFENAKDMYHWAAQCDENNKTDVCHIDSTTVMGHYLRDNHGQIITLANVLSEQEAFGVAALSDCVRQILPQYYEEREFGQDKLDMNTGTQGLYNTDGGNHCIYLAGILQLFLPGVAAAITKAIQVAYKEGSWGELQMPPPNELGLRTAEFLRYTTRGKLGRHVDGGSLFSISVAMSDEEDYTGGYFQLDTGEALFKVPRRSAIVFFSESVHSITEILGGERKTFVIELWENDDSPIGLRPDPEQFEEYKEERRKYLTKTDEGAPPNESGEEL